MDTASLDLAAEMRRALRELIADPNFHEALGVALTDMRCLAQLSSRFAAADYFRNRPDWDGLQHFLGNHILMRYALGEDVLSNGMSQPPLRDREYGLALEFGVCEGTTINRIAAILPKWRIFGFDSFEGLPETWDTKPVGAFAHAPPAAPNNVQLISGWFSDTVPAFVAEHHELLVRHGVTLLHIDSDLYSSAKCVLDHLGQYLNHDAVVIFDDYIGFPNWEQHERKAWEEFVDASGVEYHFTGTCLRESGTALKLTRNPLRPLNL